ncbi:hypothetical protein C2W62_47190, partial [Candidatus Entotheonella serta]
LEVLDWLEQTAPVLAVRGNGDEGGGGRPVVPDDPRLQDTLCLMRACESEVALSRRKSIGQSLHNRNRK